MHLARPAAPRLEPIEKVAAKAREAMKSQPINAVNVTATMAHNRTMSKAIGTFAQTVLFGGDLPRRLVPSLPHEVRNRQQRPPIVRLPITESGGYARVGVL